MKTNKLLKSSLSVAFALTVTSVTAAAWPASPTHSIAKADFGDTAASEKTKGELKKLIEEIFNDNNITNRYLGTTFFHKTSNFPYYHVTFENHSVPDDVIDTTPWYNMWGEAAEAKAKLDANSFTEKTARNAINTLNYYTQLYNFDINHELKNDGFYTTTDFKTPTMIQSYSDGQQNFYSKVKDNNDDIKNLFKDNLIGIYKQGQDIELNLVANPNKVTKIISFSVNKVSSIEPKINLGPTPQDQRQIAFSIPGELKAEQLVITNMIYLDQNGTKKETGPFALDINYKNVVSKGNTIPKYREKLNEKIQNWIDRGAKVNEWLLTKENNKDNAADYSQREKISEAITQLKELKRSSDASYDKLYKIATPIHEIEDTATLREVLDTKVAKLLEYFDLYKEDVYTKESIAKYREYIESVPKLKNTKDIKQLVQLIKEFDNATFTYLRFNTDELKRLVSIAESRNKDEYNIVSLEKFTQALNHAKDWINQTESYRPQINETSEHVKNLTNAINGLIKKNGEKGEQVPPKEKSKPTESRPYSVPAKFVERGTTKPFGLYGRDYSQVIKNVSIIDKENGRSEVTLTFEPTTTNYGATDIAPIGTIQYNKLGTISDAEVLETGTTSDNITYPKKIKLLVYSDQKNIALEGISFKDSYSLSNNKWLAPLDLYLDYSAKSETSKEEEKNPLKEALKEKINYLESKEISENYKAIPERLKTGLNQLIPQVKNIINKSVVTKEEFDKYTSLLSEETNKLDKLANLYQALTATKDTYSNFWKENTHYTLESRNLVKSKLDELENTINKLVASDIEGTSEKFTDEYGKEGSAIVYKKIDELTGGLQHLGDYLRIDTTALSNEISKAEKAYATAKDSSAKRTLKQLIDEAKQYVEHSKLTPESPDTDDQVNTDLTDYYTEQFKFAIQDLNNSQPEDNKTSSIRDELAKKVNQVSLVTVGKKEPSAFVTLTNELAKAKEVLNNNEASEDALKDALNKLSSALDTFNASADAKQTPPNTDNPANDNNISKTQLEAYFKKADLSGLSSMNSVLKNAYLITENGKNYIELELQPMLGDKNQPIGVLSKLTTFENNEEKDNVEVLSTATVNITFGNTTQEYSYPSKVRIPINGKPTEIKVNTYASSTVFGDNQHKNPAVLSLTYPKDNSIISADKKQLNALFNATTSKYYDSWNRVFKNNNYEKDLIIVRDFGDKINEAQKVLNNNSASKDEISKAFSNLYDVKFQYDLLIELRRSNADTLANFNTDKDSNNYSVESINKIDSYLQEKIDKLEDLVHNNYKSQEISQLFNDIRNYSSMLRYNISDLETTVKNAEEKIKSGKYTKDSKEKVTTAINNANNFIEKAKETRNLEDRRSDLKKELESAVANLVVDANTSPGEQPNKDDNKPSPTDILKAQLLVPLEAAKIIAHDDQLKTDINKEALDKYRSIITNAQKVFDNPKSSAEEIIKAINDLGSGLIEYTNNKSKPNTDKPNTDKPNTDKPNTDKPNTDKPNTDKPNTDKPNTDKPNTDKPNTDKPNTDKPNTDKPNTDKPAVTKQFFEDKKIGVQVELIGNSPATKLEAKEINDNQLAQNILTKLNLPNSNVRILELKLLDKDNNTVNSNAKRKVSITLKEGEKDVTVYHVKEDGSLELIKSQINGNILTFEIDHFSKFALVSKNKIDSNQISTNRKLLSNTGSQTVNSQLFGALILVLGGVLYLANKKRRN